MITKQLDARIKQLERSVGKLQRVTLRSPAPRRSRRDEILYAMKTVEGLWKDAPRTNADLKKLRKRLGY